MKPTTHFFRKRYGANLATFAGMALVLLVVLPIFPVAPGVAGFLQQIIPSTVFLFCLSFVARIPTQLLTPILIVGCYILISLLGYASRADFNELSDYLTILRGVVMISAILSGYFLFEADSSVIRNVLLFVLGSTLLIHLSVLNGNFFLSDLFYVRNSDDFALQRSFYHIYRASGTFGFPSELAIFTTILMLIYLSTVQRFSPGIWCLVVYVLAIILLSQSRAGLGVFLLGLFASFLGRRGVVAFMPQLLLGVFFTVFCFYGIVVYAPDSYLGRSVLGFDSAGNLVTRFNELELALKVLSGETGLHMGVTEYRATYGTLESNYLTQFLRGGVLSMLAEVLLNLAVVLHLLRRMGKASPASGLILFLITLFLLNGLVFNFLTGLTIQGKSAYLVWFAWGYVLRQSAYERSVKRKAALTI